MAEDEQQIAAGYRSTWKVGFPALVILGAVAYLYETKWVLAVGAWLIVMTIAAAEARLYDLCIRLRRTNELLRERPRPTD